jgi:signal transduction histidine kinase/ActR/RegA family two-component response regulator
MYICQLKIFQMKKALFLTILLLMFFTAKADHIADSMRFVLNSDTLSDTGKVATYIALADRLLHRDIEVARQILVEAIDFSHSIANAAAESVFTTQLGATYYYQGDYHITARYWLNALNISENAKDTSRIEQVLNNLGILYQAMEEYETALDYFSKSLQRKLQTGSAESIAITELNIGVLYHKMSLHDSAFLYFSRCLKEFEATSYHKALGHTYNNLGSVYMAKEDYSAAYQQYHKALDLKEHISVYDYSMVLMNIGSLLVHHLNDPDKGKTFLDKSFELANTNNLLRTKQRVQEVYSDFYSMKGDFENAYKHLKQNTLYRDSLLNIDKDTEIKRLHAIYDFEKKEQENLALSQQMEILNQEMIIKDLERQKSVQATQLMGGILFLGIIILTIISILLNKVRKAKHKLETAQDELKITNQYLQKAKEAMEQALDFKSQFLANMSHEVRTPLNVIIGLNSFMKKKITDPRLSEYIDSIEASSYNLLNLLNDVLDLSKIEAGKVILKPSNTNLKLLIEEIHSMFSLKAKEKNLQFGFDYQSKLPEFFHLDQLLLRQIVVNIVGNAIKFTDKGYVNIKVFEDQKETGVYASSLINLCIRIKDSGIGIKPEDQQHIFDSFAQAKNQETAKYGGTGLGLAISQKFARLMGGEIALESKPGEGSVFSIHLSNVSQGRREDIVIPKQRLKIEATGFKFTGGTLLVADDEYMNRNMVSSFFEDTPVKVVLAENGAELIEKARECNPTLILSDIQMPVVNGLEATRKIKKDSELRHIPIIAFTASLLFPKLDENDRKLFAGYIEKPTDIDELYDVLSQYLPNTKTKVLAGKDDELLT